MCWNGFGPNMVAFECPVPGAAAATVAAFCAKLHSDMCPFLTDINPEGLVSQQVLIMKYMMTLNSWVLCLAEMLWCFLPSRGCAVFLSNTHAEATGRSRGTCRLQLMLQAVESLASNQSQDSFYFFT